MHPVTEKWFADRTFQEPAWTPSCLVAAKAGRRVSVVLPALNEEATVGAIVAAIVPLTRGDAPLVDELVVVDSGSTDRTIEVATAAGARVVRRTDVVPHIPPLPGKGEVLWRSLAATTGDVIVFIDSDLVDFDPAFVPSLLGPILTRARRRPRQGLLPAAAAAGDDGRGVAGARRRPRHRAARPPAARRAAARAGRRGAAAGRGVRRRPASCWSRCRSRAGTAWRSGCCSTRTPGSASTGSRRSTSACASTATATCCSSG